MIKNGSKIRVSIIGSRGIPARYGGFEVFAEKIAESLSEENIGIIVYCMPYLRKEFFYKEGISRVFINTTKISFLEKFVFSSLSLFHAIFMGKINIILLLGVTGGAFLWLSNFFSIKSILNIDGIEWKRKKWSTIVRYALKALEFLSIKSADVIIADSEAIAGYIGLRYKKKSIYIPYGTGNCNFAAEDWLELEGKFNLPSNSYYLGVGRFVPENNFPMIIKGVLNSETNKKLVIVSDLSPSIPQDYLKNEEILFTGPIYNRNMLFALRKNAFAHIHGHSVGGTNPSLLEAIASQNIIICYDVAYNREVMENYGYYFKNDMELANVINFIESNPNILYSGERTLYYQNIMKEKYNWDIVSNKYLELINKLTKL